MYDIHILIMLWLFSAFTRHQMLQWRGLFLCWYFLCSYGCFSPFVPQAAQCATAAFIIVPPEIVQDILHVALQQYASVITTWWWWKLPSFPKTENIQWLIPCVSLIADDFHGAVSQSGPRTLNNSSFWPSSNARGFYQCPCGHALLGGCGPEHKPTEQQRL